MFQNSKRCVSSHIERVAALRNTLHNKEQDPKIQDSYLKHKNYTFAESVNIFLLGRS